MAYLIKKMVLGATLAATTLTVAAPAEAQRYRRYNRGGDVATGALIGGVVGLGIGAAIASNNRGRYYDRGPRGFRGRGYYNRGYGYNRALRQERRFARRAYRNGYRAGFGGGYYAPRGYYGAPRGYYGY